MCFSPKAFEELERALGVAQRAEEARKQLQVQLEEQVKEVERASEEERKSLQQELTRVKQEVVTIMKVRTGPRLNACACLYFGGGDLWFIYFSAFFFVFFMLSCTNRDKVTTIEVHLSVTRGKLIMLLLFL